MILEVLGNRLFGEDSVGRQEQLVDVAGNQGRGFFLLEIPKMMGQLGGSVG